MSVTMPAFRRLTPTHLMNAGPQYSSSQDMHSLSSRQCDFVDDCDVSAGAFEDEEDGLLLLLLLLVVEVVVVAGSAGTMCGVPKNKCFIQIPLQWTAEQAMLSSQHSWQPGVKLTWW